MRNIIKSNIDSKKIISSMISVFVLFLLFVAGPAQAFILGLSVDDSNVEQGEKIKFTATIDVEKTDQHLPIPNITLSLKGPSPSINLKSCVFDVDGKVISGCQNMTIKFIGSKYSSDYSYGYSYDYGYDYSYDYGYSYGYDYNYGYGYSYGEQTLTYEITLDTTNYLNGTYDASLKALIGNTVYLNPGSQITIRSPGSGDDDDDDEETDEESRNRRRNNIDYFSDFPPQNNTNQTNQTINLTEFNGDNPGNATEKSFASRITGAVIGAGPVSWIIIVIFLAGITGATITVRYIRKKKKL